VSNSCNETIVIQNNIYFNTPKDLKIGSVVG